MSAAPSPIDAAVVSARLSLRPPRRLPMSQWAESTIRLPEGASALPGRLRLFPYQREIADAFSDPTIERVTLQKSARIGHTMLLSCAVGHYISNDPSPIIVVQPTESDCRDYVVSDLEPLLDATPDLAGRLSYDPSGGGVERNTMMSRRFAGGFLKVIASKAPRNLRRHTARVLIVDEADAMPVGPEGPPIALAEVRTMSFADRKIIIGSTPLDAETSNVVRAYGMSDKRVFEVPCPECGEFTEILWRHIRWPEGDPSSAAYHCPECGAVIGEKHKTGMVEAGRWRVTAPEVQGHAGFRINALVSPLANASWGKLAAEFVDVSGDTDRLKPFVNTVLGEPWVENSEEADENELAGRVEPFGLDDIPDDVLILTAGADVQADRIEITVAGWSRDDACFFLGHHVVWGSPLLDDTWQEVDLFMTSTWRHPHGGILGIDAAVIDSGYLIEPVYAYCFARTGRRMWAGKGVPGPRPAILKSKTKTSRSGNRGSGRVFLIGVDTIKTTLLNRMRQVGSLRFSETLEPQWFQQLASERRVTRFVKGQPVHRHERKAGARAEALDCAVYAFAAFSGIVKNWDDRADAVRVGAPADGHPPVRNQDNAPKKRRAYNWSRVL